MLSSYLKVIAAIAIATNLSSNSLADDCYVPASCDTACCDSPGCDTDCCDSGCFDPCCLGGDCCLGDPISLFDNDGDIQIGGWWQIGYTSESTGMFNNIPDRVNTHQLWSFAEKTADGSNGLDWGFRVDFMYGIDAFDTQAFGNNVGEWDFLNGWDRNGGYGFAMPQLYGEVAIGDLSVKIGHFYTLLGYEVVTAPDNFFFSHAMTMFNSEAFTHTGVLGTYQASDDLTLYGGWTLGWDTGFDQFGEGSNFLGGFSAALTDDISFTYITTIGDMGVRGEGYSHSTVLDVAVTEKLNYVAQSDLVSFRFFDREHNDEVGFNQYLLYSLNDCWAVGTRVEWWKSDAGFNHSGQSLPPVGSASYYAATFGVNYRPHANLILRPEFRQDWFPASIGGGYDQSIFGMDAIITF